MENKAFRLRHFDTGERTPILIPASKANIGGFSAIISDKLYEEYCRNYKEFSKTRDALLHICRESGVETKGGAETREKAKTTGQLISTALITMGALFYATVFVWIITIKEGIVRGRKGRITTDNRR